MVLSNYDNEDVEGYAEAVNALKGHESYIYHRTKLSLDLENRETPPTKP